MTKKCQAFLCLTLASALSACSVADRLANVGQAPDLTPITNPVSRPGYQPISLPMPAVEPDDHRAANSLWRPGAKGFFRDQRARRVGDIMTIEVTIEDEADLSNQSSRSRTNTDNFDFGGFFGLQNEVIKYLPEPVDLANIVDLDSDMANNGRGQTRRSETIETKIAAVITQILPNGNFVIEGRQEVRVNFEVREVYVAGVVRPEDISPLNTVEHENIAELRFAYGGRGQITDVQQPRYGAQVLDIILPY
ncbi:MAG: flagellar basal body L-ring protein FlgH [Pseudomonadota bacterium]